MMREREENAMSPDGTYNGYANRETWNVCLWISNDEGLHHFAARSKSYDDFKADLREYCSTSLAYETPDGVSWNDSGVNLAEMKEYWLENFSQVTA
jgi:hypothetical protein